MNRKIGVFDSGIGGLTTLKEIQKLLPYEDFLYYADSKNNPYGEKSEKELNEIVIHIVNYLLKENVKLIVIACNTATTRCISMLREKFPDTIFVGTEPAIKVACDKNYANTLVMATPNTTKSERVKELIISNQKQDQKITLVPCEDLANAIEMHNEEKINKLLHKYLDDYKNNTDAIVLGCTHYPIIKKEIKKIIPKAKLIDGNKGVAKQVKYQLVTNGLLKNTKSKGSVHIITTKKR